MKLLLAASRLLCALAIVGSALATEVKLERVPEGGIQPQIVLGQDGTVHLLFFKGDPRAGDVFYTSKRPNESKFGASIQVNSQPGSALAMGTMRGPQFAVGKGNRIHVVWFGSDNAPKAKIGEKEVTGLIYSRMKDNQREFEPERNMITYAGQLDGGLTVAADQTGNAYVIWHGNRMDVNEEGEENRAVYIARSSDEGRTFSREEPATQKKTGACGCCGMRAHIDSKGAIYILFRGAQSVTARPEMLLVSKDHGKTFDIAGSWPWEVSTCPASTASFFDDGDSTVGVWESREKVYWSPISEKGKLQEIPVTEVGKQRHPAIATNHKGEVLVVWAEGTGWNKGGAVGWRLFDAKGKPLGATKTKDGVPVWSFASAYPEKDGTFTVLY